MKHLNSKTLLLLAVIIFGIGCKKDDEITSYPGDKNGKLAFTQGMPKDIYTTNINAKADFYLGTTNPITNETLPLDYGNYTYAKGIVSNKILVTNFQYFTWILKPETNTNWVTRASTTIKFTWDGNLLEAPIEYPVDQILMAASSTGGYNIYPLESSKETINNPLKVTVEYWRSPSTDLPAHQKQADPGVKLETKEVTFKAEYFALTNAPATITKSSAIIDLYTWLDASVVKYSAAGNPIVGFINVDSGVLLTTLDLSKTFVGQILRIRAVKLYDNGSFAISKSIAII